MGAETPLWDAVVVGVGGMGSAALFHLASSGARVLGLEQFAAAGHSHGSSHGETRIIRLAYVEGPEYIPLLRRSYALWRELEQHTAVSRKLLHYTGCISAGPANGADVRDARAVCEKHRIAHEVLSADEVRARFPAYELPSDFAAVYEESGGILEPEACVRAHVAAARASGARVRFGTTVRTWSRGADRVICLTTSTGEIIRTKSLVLSAGAWSNKLLKNYIPARALTPERQYRTAVDVQVVGWFKSENRALVEAERFPVFIVAAPEGRFYGFPAFLGSGFKIGLYNHLRESVDPTQPLRKPDRADEEALRRAQRYFPSAFGPMERAETCMFTNTPDDHFIIDQVESDVVVLAGFSGHGFKMASGIGEAAAALALGKSPPCDISLFAASRPSLQQPKL